MCVAAFAWAAHPRWRLVAIGNRDEYHDRPATPLHLWRDRGGIIAGRDLKSGGTWLGIAPAGRFALVTNLRGYGSPDPDRASRGALVTDLLVGGGAYGDPDRADFKDFNPFNLILAGPNEARFLSNRPTDIRAALAPGVYGLSNGALDEPWPKTLQLKAALLDWLNSGDSDFSVLFAALASETIPDIGLHPAQPSEIGREAPETPIFIRDTIYGTRCSTIVAIDARGGGTIIERRFSPDASYTGDTALEFTWPAPAAS